jgi:hypothetical protein
MLTDRQLATLLSALLYWREEMSGQQLEIQRPYFECQGLERFAPLTVNEVLELAQLFRVQLSGPPGPANSFIA